jgi:hypothetical protein
MTGGQGRNGPLHPATGRSNGRRAGFGFGKTAFQGASDLKITGRKGMRGYRMAAAAGSS